MFSKESTEYLKDLKRRYSKNLITNMMRFFDKNGWESMSEIWTGKAKSWEISIWRQRNDKDIYLMFSADINGEEAGDALFGVEADTLEDAKNLKLEELIDAYLSYIHLPDTYGPTFAGMSVIAASAIADFESKDKAGQIGFPIPEPFLQALSILINAQPVYARQGLDPNVSELIPFFDNMLQQAYGTGEVARKALQAVRFFAEHYCKMIDPAKLLTACAMLSLYKHLTGEDDPFDLEIMFESDTEGERETIH